MNDVCSGSGVAGGPGDAARVVLVPGHLDVALLAPGHAPAVLHEPVALQIPSVIITSERGGQYCFYYYFFLFYAISNSLPSA